MRVVVVPPDPSWPTAFSAEAQRLRDALDDVVVDVHHVGSTAIPGIHAKPIVDVLLEVTTVDRLDEREDAVVALGYEAMGELGIPGRRYFRRNDATGTRTHQIHAFATGTLGVERHLAFRDYMIAHPDEAAAYCALKRELGRDQPTIEEYVEGKDTFVRERETRALLWMRGRES